jgi:molybdenum cofactor cytidylyltransferase
MSLAVAISRLQPVEMDPSLIEPDCSFGVIILAAGRSARMGRPKLLLPWADTSVLGHLILQWRDLRAHQIAVVIAANDPVIPAELDRLGFARADRIENPDADRGMFSSIVCAAHWPGWQTSLTHWAIVLGDQPHLETQTFERLMHFADEHPERVCQPDRNGKRGHPVVLPKGVFCELATSRSADLKQFLLTHDPLGCPCDDPGLDLDIDRPEDYQRALVLARLGMG